MSATAEQVADVLTTLGLGAYPVGERRTQLTALVDDVLGGSMPPAEVLQSHVGNFDTRVPALDGSQGPVEQLIDALLAQRFLVAVHSGAGYRGPGLSVLAFKKVPSTADPLGQTVRLRSDLRGALEAVIS